MRNNLIGVIATGAWVCVGSGCSVPWTAPFSRHDETTAAPMATINRPDDLGQMRATNADQSENKSVSTITDNSSARDLAGVLDKIEQVRAIDPMAEKQLLVELRKTPADSWPMVAEQFRASLAYREQLASKRRAPLNNIARTERTAVSDSVHVSDTSLLSISRPSAPIGQLVDPRSADADGISSEALARSTPYSTPLGDESVAHNEAARTGPAEFSSDGPSYPIRSHHAATEKPSAEDTQVVQARFDGLNELDESVTSHTASERTKSRGSNRGEEDWRELVEMAAADLCQRAATSPTTTAEVHQHVSLHLLYLLVGETEQALEPIPGISPVEQDYWSRQLFALATYLDHHSQSDDKRRAAASAVHLDQAMSSLRELGSLSLRNLSFCKTVYGYGAIELCQEDRFLPGQQLTLYVEVENYRSTPTEKGYRTLLGSSYEIVTEEGTRVGGGEIPDVEDYCRSRRRDFHIQYGLTLPEAIGAGKYRLQLVIKDRQSDKIGHASASFEIRGAGR